LIRTKDKWNSSEKFQMNQVIQKGLFGIYRAVKATGALNTSWGRRVFHASYFLYKSRLEAGPTQLLQRWVRPGTVVIDVGANVGFFTLQFASWVQGGGKVIALEPEPINYAALGCAIARAGSTAVVETIQAAAAETSGEGILEINPDHPGDHKLGTKGARVDVTTIDDLLAGRGWPEVSLIKIDVQGAESRVLAGAARTIQKFWPVLFIEVDDQGLKRYGSSAREVFTRLNEKGYSIHQRVRADLSKLTLADALAIAEAKYEDFVLLPPGHAPLPRQPGA
jgi:FkbM family methyltransferase